MAEFASPRGAYSVGAARQCQQGLRRAPVNRRGYHPVLPGSVCFVPAVDVDRRADGAGCEVSMAHAGCDRKLLACSGERVPGVHRFCQRVILAEAVEHIGQAAQMFGSMH